MRYILYSEQGEDSDIYSVKIIQQGENGEESCLLNDIARSEEKAYRLLALLADNAVTVNTAPYVMDDLAECMTFC